MSSTPSHRFAHRVSIALLAVIAALIGYQSLALRSEPLPQAPPQGWQMATFNLERTFNSLDELKSARAELTRLAESLNKQREEAAQRLRSMDEELGDLQAGTDRHKEAMQALSEATHSYQAQVEFMGAKLDIERGRIMKRIYLSIRKAAEQLSMERGYAVVLVDDSAAPIPAGTEEEMNRQIAARRVVYASPEVDVTDELIKRLNAQFKSIGPAPAPSR